MTRFITDFSIARTTGAPAPTTAPIRKEDAVDSAVPPAGPTRKEAYARLESMADKALRGKGGGLPMLSREDLLQRVFPKPARGWFSGNQAAFDSFKTVELTAETARLAMADLEKLPASDFIKPGPKATVILKQAIDTQYALRRALGDYARELGSKGARNPALVGARLACDRRIGEMISMAAQLQGRPTAELEGVMVQDALAALALEMHGGKDVLEQAAARAEELFTRLNNLDQDPDKLSASFKTKAQELAGEFSKLNDQIKAGLLPSRARRGGPPVLLRDDKVFAPLRRSLGQAQARLEALARPPSLNVGGMLDEILGLTDLNTFIAEIKAQNIGAPPGLDALQKELTAQHKKLANDMEKGRLGGEIQPPLKDRLEKTHKLIEDTLLGFAVLGSSDPGVYKMYRKFEKTVDILLRSPPAYAPLAREIKDVEAMRQGFSRGGPKPWEREAFLRLAAESAVSLPALVECSLRGVPPEWIESRNAPGAQLAPPRPLGSGVVNTVTLYQFRDGEGGRLEMVFKPEHEAYHGFQYLEVFRVLGYSPVFRVAQMNTASSAVAAAIGCGGVLVKAGAGVQDGRFGLFMEKAPGLLAHDWQSKLPDLRREMETNGCLDIGRANLQRELCRLEWADILSGQMDRHIANYMADFDTMTGEVRITGIDNDASFSHGVLGPGLFKTPPKWEGPTVQNGTAVDASGLTSGQLMTLKIAIGLNQFSLPEFIDKGAYDRLLGLDASPGGDYAKTLERHLKDPEAVTAALGRLANAKTYARELERQGRVVTDWQTHRTGEGKSIREHYNDRLAREIQAGNDKELSKLKLGFYLRDWESF